jgi:hypothetical protein
MVYLGSSGISHTGGRNVSMVHIIVYCRISVAHMEIVDAYVEVYDVGMFDIFSKACASCEYYIFAFELVI